MNDYLYTEECVRGQLDKMSYVVMPENKAQRSKLWTIKQQKNWIGLNPRLPRKFEKFSYD